MGDINLLGDDKVQQEGDDNQESYSDAYGANTKELTSEPSYSDSEIDPHLYDRSYTRGSSRKVGFFIVGFLLIAIIGIASYLYMDSQKAKKKPKDALTTNKEIEPTVDVGKEVMIPAKPIEDIPTFIKEMVVASQQGVKTVEIMLSSLPQTVKFTMIQYRDGNFLAELLGGGSVNYATISNQLQQKITNGQIKILSQEEKSILGRSYKHALLNGNVVSLTTDVVNSPAYLNTNDVKNEFSQYSTESGLMLKQFDIKGEIGTPNYKKIPVIFRAVGNKEAAVNFLNKIIERNINVNLSKIVLVSSDKNFDDKQISLILNMEIYYQ